MDNIKNFFSILLLYYLAHVCVFVYVYVCVCMRAHVCVCLCVCFCVCCKKCSNLLGKKTPLIYCSAAYSVVSGVPKYLAHALSAKHVLGEAPLTRLFS